MLDCLMQILCGALGTALGTWLVHVLEQRAQ